MPGTCPPTQAHSYCLREPENPHCTRSSPNIWRPSCRARAGPNRSSMAAAAAILMADPTHVLVATLAHLKGLEESLRQPRQRHPPPQCCPYCPQLPESASDVHGQRTSSDHCFNPPSNRSVKSSWRTVAPSSSQTTPQIRQPARIEGGNGRPGLRPGQPRSIHAVDGQRTFARPPPGELGQTAENTLVKAVAGATSCTWKA